MAGQDFDALKKQALTPRLQAGAARAEGVDGDCKNTMRTIDSQNVVAKLEGSDPQLKNEYVVYSAHWDHLGVGAPVNGDQIYNGALDNASGVAALLEIARAFTQVQPQPKRSILFLVVTAEEQGLLGSRVLRDHPLYPLDEDARQHQHRRRQPVGPHQGHHRDRHGRLGSRRLPARRRRAKQGRTLVPGSRVREGLLLPLGPLQLRQAGRAGALHRHRRGLHRQARRTTARRSATNTRPTTTTSRRTR